MRIVPLRKEHIEQVQAQEAQAYISSWMTPEILQELERTMAFAAVHDGEVLGCAGIIEYWPGRATVWAVLSGRCGRHFVGIHRAAVAFLATREYKRIEATADIEFGPGHRWLQMLGFRKETARMVGYMPDGSDAAMYVRGM